MESISSPKCGVRNSHISNNVTKGIQDEETFHEHDFIPLSIKGLSSSPVIKCITCSRCYFELYGKSLRNKGPRTRFQ